MKFVEVKGDLFVPENYLYVGDESVVFAHCIASDFGMHGGIAVAFTALYDMKNKLMKWAKQENVEAVSTTLFQAFGNKYKVFIRPSLIGKAVKIDSVYNLITKDKTSVRPLLKNLEESLKDLKQQMINNGDKVLAIPDLIGCGIDGLERSDVVNLIETIFADTDITIYAVKLE